MLLARVHLYSIVLSGIGTLGVGACVSGHLGVISILAAGGLFLAPAVFKWEREQIALHLDGIALRVATGQLQRQFILYLRPFAADATEVSNPAYQPYANSLEPPTVDLETVLTRALLRWSIIKIHSETQTVGRVGGISLHDDEWQDVFARLSLQACSVILLPGNSEGVLRELRSLHERQLTTKCVFLLPSPLDKPARRRALRGLSQIGIIVPESTSIGWAVLRADADGKVLDIRHAAVKGLGDELMDLLSDIRAEASPAKSWRRQWVVRRWHRLESAFTLAMLSIPLLWWASR